jgi:hypothetical protein
MKAKLTLLLDKGTIEEAKEYAAEHDTSLSRMFEQFLRATFSKKKTAGKKVEVSDYIKSLSTDLRLPRNYDTKQEYRRHIEKKYAR